MEFHISHQDGFARRGQIDFPRGVVQTPAFMPVGTYGTVKGMLPRDITQIGAEIILGNTFHLWLRPGTDIIKAHGDLHDFMGWHRGLGIEKHPVTVHRRFEGDSLLGLLPLGFQTDYL